MKNTRTLSLLAASLTILLVGCSSKATTTSTPPASTTAAISTSATTSTSAAPTTSAYPTTSTPGAPTSSTPPTTSSAAPTTSSAAPTTSSAPPASVPTTVKVTFNGSSFEPNKISMSLSQTLDIYNPDHADHTIMSDFGFTQNIPEDGDAEITFTKAGTYNIWDQSNSNTKLTVTVS
jgi:plastocyanin